MAIKKPITAKRGTKDTGAATGRTWAGSPSLNPAFARPAATVSMAFCAANVAFLVAYMITKRDQPVAVTACQLLWAGLFVLAGLAGLELLRGRVWAQKVLLAFWATVAGAAVLFGLAAILWGTPPSWRGLFDFHPAWVIAPELAMGVAAAALLVLTSREDSRLRYGTIVTVSIVAALAVAVLANLIAHDAPVYKNLEALGRYGLSERTKTLVKSLNQPVRLTCVYTSMDENKLGSEYRPRVVELLDEMRQYSDKIDVIDASSDARKIQVVGSLKKKRSGRSTQHKQLLEDFQKDCDKPGGLLEALEAAGQEWGKLARQRDTYLSVWPVPMEISAACQVAHRKLTELRQKLKMELRSDLPDYAKLVGNVKDPIKQLCDDLKAQAEELGKLGAIPEAVAKNRPKAEKALQDALQAFQAMADILGRPGSPDPAKPGDVLRKFIEAAKNTAAKYREAADVFADLAGEDNRDLLAQSNYYNITIDQGLFSRREDLPGLFRGFLANALDSPRNGMVVTAELHLDKANEEGQRDLIKQFRSRAAEMARTAAQFDKLAKQALKALGEVDAKTKETLAAAKDGKVFDELAKPFQDLRDRVEKLPELKETDLSYELSQDNIVLVEMGDKTEVVSFDDVWPLKVAMPGADSEDKRVFNGDGAIGAKLLSMARKPFAKVWLTYYEEAPGPQGQRSPFQGMTPRAVQALRKRIEQANFEVDEWNLDQDKPELFEDEDEPAGAESQPAGEGASGKVSRPLKVLLVLPPPPGVNPQMRMMMRQMGGGFTEEHAKRVREAVNAGIPAAFLAHYQSGATASPFGPVPVDQKYGFEKMLHDDWGIEVRTKYRLVSGVPDETEAGRFRIDPVSFGYLPLSSFTDQEIGRPLRAQRMLWLNVCPVRKVETMASVTVEPVLQLTADRRDVWATDRASSLAAQIQGQDQGFVRLGPGDEQAEPDKPMPLVLAAKRTDDKDRPGIKPSRIVVLGTGMSFIDGYLDEPVPVLDRGIRFADPPRADADLVVNSLYWLIGRQEYIAAGPAHIRPVDISAGHKLVLRVVCVLVLPAIVLAAGGLVMLIRRR